MGRNGSTKRYALVSTAAAVVVVTGLTTGGGSAVASPQASAAQAPTRPDTGRQLPNYDVRSGTTASSRAAVLREGARASARTSTKALGGQALVDIDPTTGTPRMVARLDGYLTGASTGDPASIALGWVTAHRTALGLTKQDIATFRLRRDYRDIDGVHHLSWTQHAGGTTVFGNGLLASVTRAGRLLGVGGSPVSGVTAPPPARQAVASPDTAIGVARRDLRDTAAAGPRDSATPVLFVIQGAAHRAWRVLTLSANRPSLSVVDAKNGAVLFRRALGSDGRATDTAATARLRPASSKGRAFGYFPGHQPGGAARTLDYTARGWLPATAKRLVGNNSHTWSDVNDDDVAQAGEEVPASSAHRWNHRLTPFHLKNVSFCDNPYPCSWNPNRPFSWRANRKQNAAQVFFFVNNWHDHLQRAPIGFTEAAGNFETRNSSGHGKGRDAVRTQTDDGANMDRGLPNQDHVDNANMNTPPDGEAPTMQMYLQHEPHTTYPDGDPFAPTNVGDEADSVYHEYTHGLSNRLVVDPAGDSTLGDVQAGAMGEAWSDWYAMDYLVKRKLQTDAPDKVDVVPFQYDGAGVALDRTEPMDCKVGSTSRRCPGAGTGHRGGYTYADYAHVTGTPEVHSDGEIWAQTLWDLRDRLGSDPTEALLTRAMELSPMNPSFLDERNAILVADTALFGGRHRAGIWRVFAHRGMGYYAGALGADDSSPGADFHRPPADPELTTVHGRVTDSDSGRPVAGLTVTLAFQGARGLVNPSTTTGADGRYELGAVPVGTYPKLMLTGARHLQVRRPITVLPGGGESDLSVRRDWAASNGGADIARFTGPEFDAPCGPLQAIDTTTANGWSTTTGVDGTPTNTFVPKFIVVRLPRSVDVSAFGVDPSANCGDSSSSSTAGYRIETSHDRTTWTRAARGTFTSADDERLNEVHASAGVKGVRFVRFWILGNQTPEFATSCPQGRFTGCAFTDLTELAVFGVPSGP